MGSPDQPRETHTVHSRTDRNGLILLPSLAEQIGGLLVGICVCAYIQCGCPHSWPHTSSLPSSCPWSPVCPVAGSWAYKHPRPQPCSSCWHKFLHKWTHMTKSHLGFPWSPGTTTCPVVSLLETHLFPGSQTTLSTHWLIWLDLCCCSHAYLHTYSYYTVGGMADTMDTWVPVT